MSGVNKVILVGRLGKDPEVRHLEGGVAVASFSIATSETYTNKEGARVEQTEWHNIVLWRGLAEVAGKFLSKGKMVYIEGKLRTRSYEKNGEKRYATEIVGDTMTMLDRKEDAATGMAAPAETTNTASKENTVVAPPPVAVDNNASDDLPF